MRCLSFTQTKLEAFFYKVGVLIGKHPKRTILLTVICSLLLGLGAIRVTFLTSFDYLMTPRGCRAYTEEKILESLFPVNTSSNFDIYRTLNRGRLGTIIILPKNGGTVLKESIFNEIITVDRTIRTFDVKVENNSYTFNELCAKNQGSCWINDILTYRHKIREIEAKTFFLKFPVNIDVVKFTCNISALYLGGVTTDENSNVLEAKAIRLFYFLDNSYPEMEHILQKWEEKFLDITSKFKSDSIIVTRFISSSIDREMWSFALRALNTGWISIVVIILFCIISSMTTSLVRSKPWLGLCGCTSVGLAIIASFGMVMACGIECVPINIAAPFLILGIGVDDTFVLIAAWRITNPENTVQQRMGEAYAKAAISVTMTSLTNFISFSLGALTPFPALQNFCIYSAAAIVFDFIYQITFFGACMTIDGEREQQHLHPITFQPLVATMETSNRGRLYQILFTDKSGTEDSKPPKLMIWCRDYLGHWIGKPGVRIGIAIAFFFYLGGAAWSLTTLREGVGYSNLFLPDSYASPFAFNYYHYFTQFPHQVQVVINATLDYSDPAIQKQVLGIVDRFYKSPFVFDLGMNWLKYYLDFTRDKSFWLYSNTYNLSNPKDFVQCLRNVFLRHATTHMFDQDIVFDEDEVHIAASRFVIFTKDITDSAKEKAMLLNIRSIADSSPLPVTVQNLWWINYEQLLILQRLTMNAVAFATLATMFVFSLFLPHFPSVICVTITILSIEFGAIGYMAVCGVTLNSVSTVILIISIGFCVDYSAHISYSYMVAEGTYQDRIKQSLFASAMPIMQGSCSTLCSILILATIPSFMLQSFCRIIFLTISIAFLHAIFVLPTLLSMWDIISQTCTKTTRKSERLKSEIENMTDANADNFT